MTVKSLHWTFEEGTGQWAYGREHVIEGDSISGPGYRAPLHRCDGCGKPGLPLAGHMYGSGKYIFYCPECEKRLQGVCLT